MTLDELIGKIEEQGYTLSGKGNIGPLGASWVIRAPLCLIPSEPPVESECVMIPDVLTRDKFQAEGWSAVKGYARIEGAATTTAIAMVHLRFIPSAVDEN